MAQLLEDLLAPARQRSRAVNEEKVQIGTVGPPVANEHVLPAADRDIRLLTRFPTTALPCTPTAWSSPGPYGT
jgi:hypothetical protein